MLGLVKDQATVQTHIHAQTTLDLNGLIHDIADDALTNINKVVNSDYVQVIRPVMNRIAGQMQTLIHLVENIK